MKLFKVLLIALTIFTLFGVYVYIGTYIFPIAPYWVTQLPPNPSKPQIKYGEFNFKMIYSIKGKTKAISGTIICKFEGFEVRAIGESKKRVWSENIKNENRYELFHFRDDERKENQRTYSAICIENLGNYKVVLQLADAEWFLGEPNYIGIPEMPQIQIYNTETKYYLEPEQRTAFLDKYSFKVVEWFCDSPVLNVFI